MCSSDLAAMTGMINNQVDAAFASSISGPLYQLASSPRGIQYPTMDHKDKAGWERVKKVAPFFVPFMGTEGAAMSKENPVEAATYPYPILIAYEKQNADLVYGNYDSKKHAAGRNLGSAVINWFFRLVFRTPVTLTSFRCMRRELVQAVLRYDLNFTFIDGLLAWNTSRIGSVIVPHSARHDGRSGYTLRKLIVLAMNMFTNFSLLPLQMVSLLGLLAAGGGLFLGFWYLIAAIMNWLVVPGYASTIVAVLVLGGLQLLSLGVIGEYIGRLHLNVNRKPQYVVRASTDRTGPVEVQ